MKMLLMICTSLCCFMLSAFVPQAISPYPVLGYKELPFYDPFQNVERSLLIWYPIDARTEGSTSESPWDLFDIALNAPIKEANGKYPAVIISHGYTGNPHNLSWLIRGLVQNGFIVLAVQHRDLINGAAHVNHWHRAQDITLALDTFLASSLAQGVNTSNIGIAGYSLGGTTAIWVIGGRSTKLDSLIPGPEYASREDYVRADEALPTLNREMMAKDWRDPRIKKAFIMAPGWSWLFDEKSLESVAIPVYLIAGIGDRVLIPKNNAGFFAKYIPQAIYNEIPGKVGHYVFVSALSDRQRRLTDPKNQLTFLSQDDASVDRQWIQDQVIQEAVRFFKPKNGS